MKKIITAKDVEQAKKDQGEAYRLYIQGEIPIAVLVAVRLSTKRIIAAYDKLHRSAL